MTYLKNNLTTAHGVVFASLLAFFTVWTFLITNAGVAEGPGHDAAVWKATAGTITGPLTGGLARELQGCCVAFSLALMTWCAPVLLVGFAAQFVRFPGGRLARTLRMTLWVLGWLTWFVGGIVSFAHALS